MVAYKPARKLIPPTEPPPFPSKQMSFPSQSINPSVKLGFVLIKMLYIWKSSTKVIINEIAEKGRYKFTYEHSS